MRDMANSKSCNRTGVIQGLHWLHWLTITFSLFLTLFAWQFSKNQVEANKRSQFEKDSKQLVAMIEERLEKYENALRSGVATIHASGDEVSRKEWQLFSSSLNIDTRYPGVLGIGIIRYVKANELDKLILAQKKQYNSFDLHPKSSKPEYWIVTNIEPIDKNKTALGLDAAYESRRQHAITKARNSGEPTITSPIVLVQDQKQTPGFVFYEPYYKKGVHSSPKDRKQNYLGMVYMPFIAKNLMRGTLHQERRYVDFNITDDGEMVYKEIDANSENYDPSTQFEKEVTVNIYGRQWTFNIRSNKQFSDAYNSHQPSIILLGGVLIDTLLILLFIMMGRSNQKSLQLTENLGKKIDSQKAAALYASKMASLGQMAAGMAHEVNNPLAIICGYADSLQKHANKNELNNQAVLDSATKIKNTCQRISKIVHGLRSYSRDVTASPKEEADLQEIIDETLIFCEDKFTKYGVDLSYPKTLKQSVICRPVEISQIILNLLNNAFDAAIVTKEKWVRIDVSQDLEFIMIAVTDSGPGIPKEISGKIMEPFFTTKPPGKGTGLGLGICQGLIQDHGGHLKIDFNSKNTCFVIYIPKK